MKLRSFVFSILLIFKIALSSRKSAKFVFETFSQRSDIDAFKKIGTSSYFRLFGRNSKAKCSVVCLFEVSCNSFYMDGEACVFGVNGDADSFAEGERVFPGETQRIHAKSKWQFLATSCLILWATSVIIFWAISCVPVAWRLMAVFFSQNLRPCHINYMTVFVALL